MKSKKPLVFVWIDFTDNAQSYYQNVKVYFYTQKLTDQISL